MNHYERQKAAATAGDTNRKAARAALVAALEAAQRHGPPAGAQGLDGTAARLAGVCAVLQADAGPNVPFALSAAAVAEVLAPRGQLGIATAAVWTLRRLGLLRLVGERGTITTGPSRFTWSGGAPGSMVPSYDGTDDL